MSNPLADGSEPKPMGHHNVTASQAPSLPTPPPMLGQHADEILRELDLSEAEIRQLKESEAV